MEFLSYFAKIIKTIIEPMWPWLLRSTSDIRFTYPLDHGNVTDSHFEATWNYRWLFGMKLAVFHVKRDLFWPQGTPYNDPVHKILKKEINIGDQKGEEYNIIIAAVTNDLMIAIRHYVHVNEVIWTDYEIDRCIALAIHPNQMPPGMIELARVTVRLK